MTRSDEGAELTWEGRGVNLRRTESASFAESRGFQPAVRTCSISVSWELVGNPQAPPQTHVIRNAGGGGDQQSGFSQAFQGILRQAYI